VTNVLRVFTNRRAAALVLLGFASGFPLTLTDATLQAWLVRSGHDMKTVGLASFVAAPYLLKPLWAPLLDRYAPPFLGRRRGWLAVFQVLLALAVAAMAFCDPATSLGPIGVAAVCVAFASASQDIVADAYRADVLPEEERGAGAASFVTGYRIALVLVGAGVLLLVDTTGGAGLTWRAAYLAAAGAALLFPLVTLFAPEPERSVAEPESLAAAVVEPLRQFLARRDGLVLLAFVALFKLPDAVCGKMTLPFLLQSGVTEARIGAVRQGVGVAVSIAGALVGGGVVAKIGLRASLWTFGALQAASNLAFLALTAPWALHDDGSPTTAALVAVVSVENFCGGLVAAGFVGFLMSRCDPRFSATQYALLTSVLAVTGLLAGATSGYLQTGLGWPGFFVASVLMAAPGMALLTFVVRDGSQPPPVSDERRAR
jgi:PAT family beta-lactamase induction signal transducer AmpG